MTVRPEVMSEHDQGAHAPSAEEHVWFLERLDRVNRAIQSSVELEDQTPAALEVTRLAFDTDRAFLLDRCDPTAAHCSVFTERTHPDHPGAFAKGELVALSPELCDVMLSALADEHPVPYELVGCRVVPVSLRNHFGVQSMIVMAVRPRVGPAFLFGMHHCRSPRVWSSIEIRLFEEIGRRLEDALTSQRIMSRLQLREGQLAEAQVLAGVGHWDHDYRSGELTISREALAILGLPLGYRPADIQDWRQRWAELVIPEDRATAIAAIEQALETGEMTESEYRITLSTGEQRAIVGRGRCTRDADGRPLRVFGIVQDVTDRRLVLDAVRASATRFRTFVDHAADAFYLHDGEGRIADLNQGVIDMLGYDRDELIGRHADHFDADHTLEEIRVIIARLRLGHPVLINSHHRHKNGTLIPVEVRIRPIDMDGVMCAVSVARDMTPRENSEHALRDSHHLLDSVIEGTSDAIFVKDRDGRYLLINSSGARMLGHAVAEVVGRSDHELVDAASARAIEVLDRSVLERQRAWTSTETMMIDGVTRHFLSTKDVYRDSAGRALGVIGISRDITETRELEEQLRQSQKMEAVGRLAGGIAHDFNNLLTVINGYSAMVLEQYRETDPNHALLRNILRCGERAANLTRQLLAFGRKQVLQPQVLQLCMVLADLREMLHRLIGEDIELEIIRGTGACRAKVDRSQFEQAVVNLCINARDAMPRGGQLVLETSEVELTTARLRRTPDVKPGRYIQLTVTDDGEGMDEETRVRIFEPFFTTKEAGKGTGLGLAMVYGFVKQSGGHLEVQSRVGEGSSFRIYLPCASESEVPIETSVQSVEVPRGDETLLLVEDEAPVRLLLKLALESYGYRILEARTGEQAVEIARDHKGPIALLITDLVMPRMSGPQLIESLARSHPGLRTITMSGYPGDSVPPLGPKVAFLQKPFQPSLLARKVREMLDAKD